LRHTKLLTLTQKVILTQTKKQALKTKTLRTASLPRVEPWRPSNNSSRIGSKRLERLNWRNLKKSGGYKAISKRLKEASRIKKSWHRSKLSVSATSQH